MGNDLDDAISGQYEDEEELKDDVYNASEELLEADCLNDIEQSFMSGYETAYDEELTEEAEL